MGEASLSGVRQERPRARVLGRVSLEPLVLNNQLFDHLMKPKNVSISKRFAQDGDFEIASTHLSKTGGQHLACGKRRAPLLQTIHSAGAHAMAAAPEALEQGSVAVNHISETAQDRALPLPLPPHLWRCGNDSVGQPGKRQALQPDGTCPL